MAKLIAPEIEVRAADRGLHDLVGDGIRGFRTVDHPPGNDDLLIVRCRPFEIGHGNLAVRAGLQRLQKFLGDDGLRVTLALYRQFIHIHRVGDIDGENQFDIDGGRGFLLRRQISGIRRGDTRDVASSHRSRDKHRPDRDTPAHSGPPVDKCRRFEVPAPGAASSYGNFKSKSGT
jgi:hypothetical protein